MKEESACDVVGVISLLPQTKQTCTFIIPNIFWKCHQDGQIGEKGDGLAINRPAKNVMVVSQTQNVQQTTAN